MKPRNLIVTLELTTALRVRTIHQLLRKGEQLLAINLDEDTFPLGIVEQCQVNSVRQARAEKLANRRRAAVRHP